MNLCEIDFLITKKKNIQKVHFSHSRITFTYIYKIENNIIRLNKYHFECYLKAANIRRIKIFFAAIFIKSK